MAEIETRIETLRAQTNGTGQPLARLDVIALAGRWYTWYVKQHEDKPGPEKRWRELSDPSRVGRDLSAWAGTYLQDPETDPHWDWAKEAEVREAVRPQVPEEAALRGS